MFSIYLARWNLTPDGDAIVTPRARLLPVSYQGGRAMLKIATFASEIRGNRVMAWWGDDPATGAAPVLAVDGEAILLARSHQPGSLLGLLDEGRADEAIAVIVATAAALHAPRTSAPPPDLPPLEQWFSDLHSAADRLGGVLHASAAAAATLLVSSAERVVLHGDLHHENILDFGDGAWLAIDPKGVVGERAFDLVHHLFDPDDPNPPNLRLIEQQLALTADLAGVDSARLRQWLLAWAGLSAAWWLDDAHGAAPALAVAAAMAGP